MAVRQVRVTLEDVDGSFQRFLERAPEEFRELARDAVAKTTVAVWQRMKAAAPRGPDAPHIREALSYRLPRKPKPGKQIQGQAGILSDRAQEPAAPGATGEGSTLGHVALYQEYGTDHHGAQPFMLPAALGEASAFRQRAIAALKGVERSLSTTEAFRGASRGRVIGGGGGGLL